MWIINSHLLIMTNTSEDKYCKTCKFAKFVLTPSGRIKKDWAGECTYELILPSVPASMEVYSKSFGIWPDSGKNCPTYIAIR